MTAARPPEPYLQIRSLGAAPGGAVWAVLEQYPLGAKLVADAVGLGEVAALLGGGTRGDALLDRRIVALALKPSRRVAREETHQAGRSDAGEARLDRAEIGIRTVDRE